MLDIAIVGGEIVDGTGSSRRRADLGIKDGRITDVGEIDEPAARVIDAEGRIVSPGFIDVHTHYDAQVIWDGDLTPSPLHGVTTVLGGNCGFTLAPMNAESFPYLAEMLSRVEGMPLASLQEGLELKWRTFAEYLDHLDGRVALNIGFLVGHSTVRHLVLGDDWQRAATDDEIESMCRLVSESLAGGALGFSSSWSDTHNDADGDPVPSRFATVEELLRLCACLEHYPGTWLEFIPWATGPFPDDRAQLMGRMSAAAGGRPLNWNLLTASPTVSDDVIANRLAASDTARDLGGSVYALTLPTPVSLRINLDSGFLFDMELPWREVLGRAHHAKMRELGDPDVRRRLAGAAQRSNGSWYNLENLQFDQIGAPEYADLVGRPVAAAARDRGADPFDLLFDVALADDLTTVFRLPPQGDDAETWRRRLALWRDPRTIVGGSDAGAHLDMLDTFGFYSGFVGPTVRDRQLLPLEEAIKMITDDAARAFGLRGRGLLAAGYAADIVVFDEANVGSTPVAARHDLPAGGMRLYSEGVGIDAVLVNGVAIAEHGVLTGARSGTVLRSGRDTENVITHGA